MDLNFSALISEIPLLKLEVLLLVLNHLPHILGSLWPLSKRIFHLAFIKSILLATFSYEGWSPSALLSRNTLTTLFCKISHGLNLKITSFDQHPIVLFIRLFMLHSNALSCPSHLRFSTVLVRRNECLPFRRSTYPFARGVRTGFFDLLNRMIFCSSLQTYGR